MQKLQCSVVSIYHFETWHARCTTQVDNIDGRNSTLSFANVSSCTWIIDSLLTPEKKTRNLVGRGRSTASKNMEFSWDSHHDVTKRLATLVGQWPYQNRRERILRMGMTITAALVMNIPQVRAFFNCFVILVFTFTKFN